MIEVEEANREAVRAVLELRLSNRVTEQSTALVEATHAFRDALAEAANAQRDQTKALSGKQSRETRLTWIVGTVSVLLAAVLSSYLTKYFSLPVRLDHDEPAVEERRSPSLSDEVPIMRPLEKGEPK